MVQQPRVPITETFRARLDRKLYRLVTTIQQGPEYEGIDLNTAMEALRLLISDSSCLLRQNDIDKADKKEASKCTRFRVDRDGQPLGSMTNTWAFLFLSASKPKGGSTMPAHNSHQSIPYDPFDSNTLYLLEKSLNMISSIGYTVRGNQGIGIDPEVTSELADKIRAIREDKPAAAAAAAISVTSKEKRDRVIPFKYEGHEIRVVYVVYDEQEEPWWVAKDVCEVLGIDATQTRRLDEDEKGLRFLQTPGGPQELLTINESGLYTLILRSNKPQAKSFRKWVTSEVLPALRKTGSYTIPRTIVVQRGNCPAPSNPSVKDTHEAPADVIPVKKEIYQSLLNYVLKRVVFDNDDEARQALKNIYEHNQSLLSNN